MKKIFYLLLVLIVTTKAQSITADLSVSVEMESPGFIGGNVIVTITNNGPDTVQPQFIIEDFDNKYFVYLESGLGTDCSFAWFGTDIVTINGYTGHLGTFSQSLASGNSISCNLWTNFYEPLLVDSPQEAMARVTVGHQIQNGETFLDTNWADNTETFSMFELSTPTSDLAISVQLDHATPHLPQTDGQLTISISNNGPDVYDQVIYSNLYINSNNSGITFSQVPNNCEVQANNPIGNRQVISFFNFPQNSIGVGQTIQCQVNYHIESTNSEIYNLRFYTSTIHFPTRTSETLNYHYFGDPNMENNLFAVEMGHFPAPQVIPSLSILSTLLLIYFFTYITAIKIKK